MSKNNWTREQTIIALATYCKIPFNLVSSRHPEVVKVAGVIGRSPNAVKMKIGNFGSYDPELRRKGIVGLSNSSDLDGEIWAEFSQDWERLAFESEMLKAKFLDKSIEEVIGIEDIDLPMGLDRMAMVRQRVNQDFFRSTILASYNQKCCITGLNVPELLVASHIVPWSVDQNNRLNPCNGLCLNALHDKAFDTGLISVSLTYEVIISKKLSKLGNNSAILHFLGEFEGKPLILPDKFLPDKKFLEFHQANIFIK